MSRVVVTLLATEMTRITGLKWRINSEDIS